MEVRDEALARDDWDLRSNGGVWRTRRGAELSVVRQLRLSHGRRRHQLRIHHARAVPGDGERHRRLLRSQHAILTTRRTVRTKPSATLPAQRRQLIDVVSRRKQRQGLTLGLK